ncbi:XRE family transcriptional regulator [Pollutimonas subterranea]|uniref:XRE family transcriptional regulator n=1 Tax=Pollutimonas subterranea TaxID=2045210 RepID=A0A2N4U288_9BURK|nr:XRE family transcriptional regulator [Pollutimonas subterranea]PLC49132.1 XRE family transcriptional regulator [Pollutimonas subterranea]
MQDPANYLAQALKQLRTRRAWSLDHAARETGVSKAMLGQIERAESSPTIATLWKIATGFQAPISSFLHPPAEMTLDESIGAEADTDRRGLAVEPGIVVRSLFAYDARFGFELLELILVPGAVRLSEPHAAGVTEHVTVISGTMELLVEGRWIPLSEGSAVRFAADRPHGYRNLAVHSSTFHNLIHYPAGYEKSGGGSGSTP